MPKYYSLFVLVIFGLFLIPNLIEISRGSEHFPFSNNPMFGHYVTTQDTTVTLNFLLVDPNRTIEPLDFTKHGLWEVKLKRYYFSNVYGSSETGSPQGYFTDGQGGFEQRNEFFFQELSDLIQQKEPEIIGVYLMMDWVTPTQVIFKSDTLGYYEVESKSFISL